MFAALNRPAQAPGKYAASVPTGCAEKDGNRAILCLEKPIEKVSWQYSSSDPQAPVLPELDIAGPEKTDWRAAILEISKRLHASEKTYRGPISQRYCPGPVFS